VYVFAYSGLLPEWILINRFIETTSLECLLFSFPPLRKHRELGERKSWKIKDVVFFSQPKISGTDMWIKQVGVFSSRQLSPNAEYNSASIAP